MSWFLRRPNPDAPGIAPFVLAVIGVVLALVTGWLGGELVERLGVGVDEGANLDAPSSLAGPAGGDEHHELPRYPGEIGPHPAS